VALIDVDVTVRAGGERFGDAEVHLWPFGDDRRVHEFRHVLDTAEQVEALRPARRPSPGSHRAARCERLGRLALVPRRRRTDMPRRRAVLGAVATLGLVPCLADPASAARVYAGQQLSERLQLVLDVSDDGTRIEGMSFFIDMTCRRSDPTVDMGRTTSVAALPAQPAAGSHLLAGGAIAGGRLTATLLTARARGQMLMDVVRGELAGTVTASAARGTLLARRTVVEVATGRGLRSCTRSIPWRAGRATSAGAPVVLRVTRDHRRVTQSLISWAAPCRRATFYREPTDEWLLPFRLSPGGAFAQSYRYDAGDQGQVIGRFAGRVRETTASGSFRSRFQSRRDRCVLAPQTWTAATG
jgi:hypothetical protein